MTKFPLLLLLASCFFAHSSASGSEFLSIATLVVGGAGPEAKTENNEAIPESFYATNIDIIEPIPKPNQAPETKGKKEMR